MDIDSALLVFPVEYAVPGKVLSVSECGKRFILVTYRGRVPLSLSDAKRFGYTPRLYDIVRADIKKRQLADAPARFSFFCDRASFVFHDDPDTKSEARVLHEQIRNDVAGAEKTERLLNALMRFPNDKYLLGDIAEQYLSASTPDPKAAAPYIERLLFVDPVDNRSLKLAIWHAGLLKDAARVWDLSVKMYWVNPTLNSAQYQLGELSRQEGRLVQAKYHFECIVRHDPTYVKALRKLRDIAQLEGDRAAFRRYEDRIIKLKG
jgi:hypothetical protein